MKYYKIMTFENKIIGAISSSDFVRYSSIGHSYIRCTEKKGEYVVFNGITYRAAWMAPCQTDRTYIEAQVIEISEDEYQIFIDAIEHNEEIPDEKEDIPPLPEPTDDIQQETLEFIRSSKIKEMSYQCNKTIENGFDIETEDGIHHYSYALEDQLNLMNLSAAIARGEEQLSYHADGELCRFYTAAEINEIISTGNAWKTYHTTYFNALKSYINSLETIEEISAITYGMELPEEFKTDVLRVIE